MRQTMLSALLVVIVNTVYSQTNVGVGIVLGVPSGIHGTYIPSSTRSVDVQLAWSVEHTFFAQGHYDIRLVTLHRGPDHTIELYGGPGIFLRLSSYKRDLLGFSGNFGVCWAFSNRLEVFSELAPKVGLISATEIDITGGLGFRYIF